MMDSAAARRLVWSGAVAALACAGVSASVASVAAALPGPVTFSAVGSKQSYVVPGGVGSLQVTVVGAPGGNASNGAVGGNAEYWR